MAKPTTSTSGAAPGGRPSSTDDLETEAVIDPEEEFAGAVAALPTGRWLDERQLLRLAAGICNGFNQGGGMGEITDSAAVILTQSSAAFDQHQTANVVTLAVHITCPELIYLLPYPFRNGPDI